MQLCDGEEVLGGKQRGRRGGKGEWGLRRGAVLSEGGAVGWQGRGGGLAGGGGSAGAVQCSRGRRITFPLHRREKCRAEFEGKGPGGGGLHLPCTSQPCVAVASPLPHSLGNHNQHSSDALSVLMQY